MSPFVALQYVIPQRLLTQLMGKLAESRTPWLKKLFIHWFAKRYQIDLSQAAVQELDDFACFNDFFTRELKAGARPIASAIDAICCPADGAISQLGDIWHDRIFQAKGQDYCLEQLLGSQDWAQKFIGGQFITVYLSPRDYHRVHMPLSGDLIQTRYIPGKLFSVNQATAEQVPALFARNERLVCLFQSELGPFAVILVGAMVVAGIESVWAGREQATQNVRDTSFNDVHLKRGEELGRFLLGSTAIVVLPKGMSQLDPNLQANDNVRMGQELGKIKPV